MWKRISEALTHHKDVYYISVAKLTKALEKLSFDKIKPLLEKWPFAQNFNWSLKWYDIKHPRFEVLDRHPNEKYPEFPWSFYKIMMTEFDFKDTDPGEPEVDAEESPLLVYFDKKDRDMLVHMCPDLEPHFNTHRMMSYFPYD